MAILHELACVVVEDCRQRVARKTALHCVTSGEVWVVVLEVH
jgi:hypothetical protein